MNRNLVCDVEGEVEYETAEVEVKGESKQVPVDVHERLDVNCREK